MTEPLQYHIGICTGSYVLMHVYTIKKRGHCYLSAEPAATLVATVTALLSLIIHAFAGILPWPLFSYVSLYTLGLTLLVSIVGHVVALGYSYLVNHFLNKL